MTSSISLTWCGSIWVFLNLYLNKSRTAAGELKRFRFYWSSCGSDPDFKQKLWFCVLFKKKNPPCTFSTNICLCHYDQYLNPAAQTGRWSNTTTSTHRWKSSDPNGSLSPVLLKQPVPKLRVGTPEDKRTERPCEHLSVFFFISMKLYFCFSEAEKSEHQRLDWYRVTLDLSWLIKSYFLKW